MPVALSSPLFVVAAVCAAVMGYAIQRGATCMVAAIDEVITDRRATRIVALVEAALWVAGGIVVASLLGGLSMRPAGYPVSSLTIDGGALLGIGALINRACVFGSIARLGSGEWAYAATPVGFLAGCLIAAPLSQPASATMSVSPLFAAAPWIVAPLLLFAIWRGATIARAAHQRRLAAHIWSPHQATMVIGLAFVVMLLAVGSWAYTEALVAFARGMLSGTAAKLLLFAALLAGALAGGWTAGRLRNVAPTGRAVVRCLIGGVLLAWGSLLVPGSNDGLILLGLPLLQPHAYVALASMVVAITAGMAAERRLAHR